MMNKKKAQIGGKKAERKRSLHFCIVKEQLACIL